MKHFRGGRKIFPTCSAALLRLVVGWVANVMTPWLGEPARPPSQISTPIARGHEDSRDRSGAAGGGGVGW